MLMHVLCTLVHALTCLHELCVGSVVVWGVPIPAIAQLVEHLTVDRCSNQMVPGSIPGGRILELMSHCKVVSGIRWNCVGPCLEAFKL